MPASHRFISAAAALLFMAANCIAQTPASDDATYRALGGIEGIHAIVEDLLKAVVADERIKDKFKDIDMKHLGERLAEQFCELSGGPCKYGGKDMAVIHEDLAITDAQFNALAEDLQDAMRAHGVPSAAQNRLLAKLAPMERRIVTK